jgi:hypothetical protein
MIVLMMTASYIIFTEDARPNKALQRTPSRGALLSYDRFSSPSTPQPELVRLIGVAELGVGPNQLIKGIHHTPSLFFTPPGSKTATGLA